jgi:hypothetical protein
MDLISGLSPAPEVSFSGPVDTALAAAAQDELMGRLAAALQSDGRAGPATRVSIAADGDAFRTVIESGADGAPVEWILPAQPGVG